MFAAANAAKREAAANAAIMAELKSVTTTKVVECKLIPKTNANKPKTEHLQRQPVSRAEIINALFEAAPIPCIYVPQLDIQSGMQVYMQVFVSAGR
jgi:hypothetical protein